MDEASPGTTSSEEMSGDVFLAGDYDLDSLGDLGWDRVIEVGSSGGDVMLFAGTKTRRVRRETCFDRRRLIGGC